MGATRWRHGYEGPAGGRRHARVPAPRRHEVRRRPPQLPVGVDGAPPQARAALCALGRCERTLGPAQRALYRYFWGPRPVPAGVEATLHRLLWRPSEPRAAVGRDRHVRQPRPPWPSRCPPLCAQLRAGDELVVVDNASATTRSRSCARSRPAPSWSQRGERGFAAGANAGARAAGGDLLVFLNPDATPAPGFARGDPRAARGRRGWTAWMGLVTADGGRVVNTNGGVVHFTGIAWAGEAGARRPAALRGRARRRSCPARASRCRARRGSAAGGFAAPYFMYHEDVDLSLRLRLAGRPARRRAGRSGRPRLRVRQGRRRSGGGSSATAGRRSCAPIRGRLLLAAARRRCSPPSSRCSRWPPPAAGCRRSSRPQRDAARAAAPAARAPRGAGDPHDLVRPSSPRGSRRTSTRRSSAARARVRALRWATARCTGGSRPRACSRRTSNLTDAMTFDRLGGLPAGLLSRRGRPRAARRAGRAARTSRTRCSRRSAPASRSLVVLLVPRLGGAGRGSGRRARRPRARRAGRWAATA